MKFFRLILLIIALSATAYVSAKQKKVLVSSKTSDFRHCSAIAAGKRAIQELGTKNNFQVDTTENAEIFTANNLKQYTAVVFLCTTGNVLNDQQQKRSNNSSRKAEVLRAFILRQILSMTGRGLVSSMELTLKVIPSSRKPCLILSTLRILQLLTYPEPGNDLMNYKILNGWS